MFEKLSKLRVPILLTLLVALMGCAGGRGQDEHDEVATTLRGILDQNPNLVCAEIEVLNEYGVGAAYRYYTARATCTDRGAQTPLPVSKHYELRYERVADGWSFKTIREVSEAFAEDPESRGPAPFKTRTEGSRGLAWILGTAAGLILVVLIFWIFAGRVKALSAVARRFGLTRTKQPHQEKRFDSTNPLD